MFAVGEARWELGALDGNVDLWINTSDQTALGGGVDDRDHGAYTNIGGALGAG